MLTLVFLPLGIFLTASVLLIARSDDPWSMLRAAVSEMIKPRLEIIALLLIIFETSLKIVRIFLVLAAKKNGDDRA